MKRRNTIARLAALVIGGLGLTLCGPAYAICTSTGVGFNSYNYGSGCTAAGGTLCEVITPTGHGASQVISSFWAYQGTGTVGGNQTLNQSPAGCVGGVGCSCDGTTTCGVDNGTAVDTGTGPTDPFAWLHDTTGTPNGHMFIGGQWGSNIFDSCLVGKTAPLHTEPIQLISFVDQDSAGCTYVALAAARLRCDTVRYDGTVSDTTCTGTLSGSSQNIVLVPIAQFGITGSVKTSSTVTNVTVASPTNPVAGVYTDGSLSGAEIAGLIKGFRVYVDENTYVAGPPAANNIDRLRSGTGNTWTPIGSTRPYGSSANFDVTCASNVNDRLAYSVVFDSNWETEMVSCDSKAVACGSTLATPEGPGRPILKPGRGPKKSSRVD